MNNHTSTQNHGGVGLAMLGYLVASITFLLGYAVMRASLNANALTAPQSGTEYSALPSEGALWKKGFDYL